MNKIDNDLLSQCNLTHLLTGSEVAKILRVSRSFAYRLMRRGDIPIVRFGRSVRVRQEDLRDFIETRLDPDLT